MIISEIEHITDSPEETMKLAGDLAGDLIPGDVVALTGELGSGKTQFVKGLGYALGIVEIISPSFTIVRQYEGKLTLTHIDLYRIEDPLDGSLILEEYISEEGITAIEWADRAMDYIPEGAYLVHFEFVNTSSRRIRIARLNQ